LSTNGAASATTRPDARSGGAFSALFDAALAARTQAYAPYSRFAVGAALRSVEGGIFAGCNVENAAYPIGTCAEAGAIAAMIAHGHHRIAECVVIGGDDQFVTPCGGCRQRLREFASGEVLIHCAKPSGASISYTVAALLPASFGPEHLAEAR
jgi:cytidine deaminase